MEVAASRFAALTLAGQPCLCIWPAGHAVAKGLAGWVGDASQ